MVAAAIVGAEANCSMRRPAGITHPNGPGSLVTTGAAEVVGGCVVVEEVTTGAVVVVVVVARVVVVALSPEEQAAATSDKANVTIRRRFMASNPVATSPPARGRRGAEPGVSFRPLPTLRPGSTVQ